MLLLLPSRSDHLPFFVFCTIDQRFPTWGSPEFSGGRKSHVKYIYIYIHVNYNNYYYY